MERLLLIGLMALMTSGCATSWYNTNYTSREAHERQKTIDTAQCTLHARGAAPIPAGRVYQSPNQSYSFTGSVNSYGSSGYQRSDVRGRIMTTPDPGASFATGFANGAAMGQVIAARRAQNLAFTACMYQLGWTDTRPAGFALADGAVPTAPTKPAQVSDWSDVPPGDLMAVPDYRLSPEAEVNAQRKEFFDIHTQYVGRNDAVDRLVAAVVEIEQERPGIAPNEAMLQAHRRVGPAAVDDKSLSLQGMYGRAMSGDAQVQFVLAGFHHKGEVGAVNLDRAVYWATRSAKAGYADSYALLALLYTDRRFERRDMDTAYRLAVAARSLHSEMAVAAKSRLTTIMTPQESESLKGRYGPL